MKNWKVILMLKSGKKVAIHIDDGNSYDGCKEYLKHLTDLISSLTSNEVKFALCNEYMTLDYIAVNLKEIATIKVEEIKDNKNNEIS